MNDVKQTENITEFTIKKSKKKARAGFRKDMLEYGKEMLEAAGLTILTIAGIAAVVIAGVGVGKWIQAIPEGLQQSLTILLFTFLALIGALSTARIAAVPIFTYKVRLRARIFPLTEGEMREAGIYASESADRNMAEWVWIFLRITGCAEDYWFLGTAGYFITNKLKNELVGYVDDAASKLGFQRIGKFDGEEILECSYRLYDHAQAKPRDFKQPLDLTQENLTHEKFVEEFVRIVSHLRSSLESVTP